MDRPGAAFGAEDYTVFNLNDLPFGPPACLSEPLALLSAPEADSHQGEHKCKYCGSNNHPSKWCPDKPK